MTDPLAAEMAELRQKLDDHIDETRQLRESVEERLRNGDKQFRLVLECINDNTAAIRKLNENTSGVVTAYQDVQASARVGNAVLHVVWSMIKAGGVLAALGYAINALIEHFKRHPPSN